MAAGATFGIITALTFELVPVDMPFTSIEFEFPWSATESLVTAWQKWLPTAPPQTWTAVELLTQDPRGGGPPSLELEVVHAGTEAEARAAVADLLGAAGAAPTTATVDTGPFLDVERDFYCKGLRRKECTLADKTRRESSRGRPSTRSPTWPQIPGRAMAC